MRAGGIPFLQAGASRPDGKERSARGRTRASAGLTSENIGAQEADVAKELKDQEAIKKDVIARMKRIEGQLRGIQRMIEEGKECEDILVQMRAARSALRSANAQILRRYLARCNDAALKSGDPKEQYEKLLKVVSDFIDG